MSLKDKYNTNCVLKDNTLLFDILEADLINFADFLTLINRGMGLAALDIEDFKSGMVGRDTVDFRAHAGDNLTSVTTEILEFIPAGTHVIYVIATNEPVTNAEEIETCNGLIQEKSHAEYFYWNIYETEQKEKYKIYVLITDVFE